MPDAANWLDGLDSLMPQISRHCQVWCDRCDPKTERRVRISATGHAVPKLPKVSGHELAHHSPSIGTILPRFGPCGTEFCPCPTRLRIAFLSPPRAPALPRMPNPLRCIPLDAKSVPRAGNQLVIPEEPAATKTATLRKPPLPNEALKNDGPHHPAGAAPSQGSPRKLRARVRDATAEDEEEAALIAEMNRRVAMHTRRILLHRGRDAHTENVEGLGREEPLCS